MCQLLHLSIYLSILRSVDEKSIHIITSICPLNIAFNAAKTYAFVQVRAQPAQKAKLAQKLPGGNDKEKKVPHGFAGKLPSRTKNLYILSKEV